LCVVYVSMHIRPCPGISGGSGGGGGGGGGGLGKSSSLAKMLGTCAQAVQQLAYEVQTRSVLLCSMRVVLARPAEALALMLGSTTKTTTTMATATTTTTIATATTATVGEGQEQPVNEALLEDVRAVVAAFDARLEAVQYFLTNYCNDGDLEVYEVPTNVAAIKAGVDVVVQRLSDDNYTLLDIEGSTVPQLTDALDHFPQVGVVC
jgi:hypothetical protein